LLLRVVGQWAKAYRLRQVTSIVGKGAPGTRAKRHDEISKRGAGRAAVEAFAPVEPSLQERRGGGAEVRLKLDETRDDADYYQGA
jgi:hypothetical protein